MTREGQGDLRRLDLHSGSPTSIPSRTPRFSLRLDGRRAARRRREGARDFPRRHRRAAPTSASPPSSTGSLRRRRSLVHDLPGMTRDVLEEEAHLPDGRTFRLFDTGGYDPSGQEEIPAAVRRKALEAIRERGPGPARRGRVGRDRCRPTGPRPRRRAQSGVETIVVGQQDRPQGGGARARSRPGSSASRRCYGVSAEHAIGIDDILDGDRARRLPPAVRGDGGRTGRPGGPRRSRSPSSGAPTSGSPRSSTRCSAPSGRSSRRSPARRATPWTRASSRSGQRVPAGGHGRHPPQGEDARRGPRCSPSSRRASRSSECDVAILVLDAAEGADRPGRDGGLLRRTTRARAS